jgi:hypothetical protein
MSSLRGFLASNIFTVFENIRGIRFNTGQKMYVKNKNLNVSQKM